MTQIRFRAYPPAYNGLRALGAAWGTEIVVIWDRIGEIMSKLIALQNDLGLGHKGDILLTTQKRFDSNQEAIAKDIIDKDYAERIIHRWNAFEEGGLVEELRTALKDVLKRIKDSEEWWIDCPDKGGFDTERLEAALAKS